VRRKKMEEKRMRKMMMAGWFLMAICQREKVVKKMTR
jgi:hypothetical protein